MHRGETSSTTAGTDAGARVPGHDPSRRRFLAGTAAVGTATAGAAGLGGCGDGDGESPDGAPTTLAIPLLDADPFTLGVASGDPDDTSVILWTRLVIDPDRPDGGVGTDPIPVAWQVASDEAFDTVVASGTETAELGFAHSVHATAEGLDPDGTYWYRFSVGGLTSPTGRTRTMPTPGDAPTSGQFRLAMATCQDFQGGYYAAWQDAASVEDLDLVVFLGDYIYELPNIFTGPDGDTSRHYTSPVPTDLEGFRARYSQVKGDTQLIAAHQHAPFFAMWDDHEVVNNYTVDVDPSLRQAAYQAWWEHLPVRLPPPRNGELEAYRPLRVGSLLDLFIVDTRQYTDAPPCPGDDGLGTVPDCPERSNPRRTLLGAAQRNWLLEQLAGSTATWTALANPVLFAGLVAGEEAAEAMAEEASPTPKFFMDTWDGFPVERDEVRSALAKVDNPVVLTGDYHASFVLDVLDPSPADDAAASATDGRAICPEFLVTAISSILFSEDYTALNPQVRYFEAKHGYALCTVTAEQFSCEFRYVDNIWDPASTVTAGPTWAVAAGERTARELATS